MRSNLFWLSDEQWSVIQPLLPTDVRGKERVDDRRVISGDLIPQRQEDLHRRLRRRGDRRAAIVRLHDSGMGLPAGGGARHRRVARRHHQIAAMTWLGLLKALLIAAGAAEAIAAQLKGALDEIARADSARDSVRRDLERDPSRLRDDDGFERK